jgi:hypothetical protein
MGGQIEWSALDVFCEMYGVTDVELLIVQLTAIREHQVAQSRLQHGRG